jgi:hypothetical protein
MKLPVIIVVASTSVSYTFRSWGSFCPSDIDSCKRYTSRTDKIMLRRNDGALASKMECYVDEDDVGYADLFNSPDRLRTRLTRSTLIFPTSGRHVT